MSIEIVNAKVAAAWIAENPDPVFTLSAKKPMASKGGPPKKQGAIYSDIKYPVI